MKHINEYKMKKEHSCTYSSIEDRVQVRCKNSLPRLSRLEEIQLLRELKCVFDLLQAEHALTGFKLIGDGAWNASYARRCSRYEFGRKWRILRVLRNSDLWYPVMIFRRDGFYSIAKQLSRR